MALLLPQMVTSFSAVAVEDEDKRKEECRRQERRRRSRRKVRQEEEEARGKTEGGEEKALEWQVVDLSSQKVNLTNSQLLQYSCSA